MSDTSEQVAQGKEREGSKSGDEQAWRDLMQGLTPDAAGGLEIETAETATPDTSNSLREETRHDDADEDVQAFTDSYWYATGRSLVAFRTRSKGEPKELARQAVWWIRRAEQRFLFGYSWELLSDTEQVVLRRLSVSLAPDSTINVCAYGTQEDPATGSGTFDGKHFTVNMVDGDLMHWAHMVRAEDLDEVLPGCTVSINELIELHPAAPGGRGSEGSHGPGGCAGTCPLAETIFRWFMGYPEPVTAGDGKRHEVVDDGA